MSNLKVMPVRIDTELYKDLRKLSYLSELPMSELIRQAIKLKIDECKKVLTNSDIAI